MQSMARSHVWWPNLDANIEKTTRKCSQCVTCSAPLSVDMALWPLEENPHQFPSLPREALRCPG